MQRSGKTLIAYKLARYLQDQSKSAGCAVPVYTNLYCPEDRDFRYVDTADQLPLDLQPKIILIDEVYNGMDAQDYRKLKNISIFLNTIGKQNCLFIWTSIEAAMVYNRLRNQTAYMILVKGSPGMIRYKIFDQDTQKSRDFGVLKNAKLFENVHYSTDFIPVEFDWDMGSWKQKLQEFYKVNYGMDVNVK